LNDAPILDPAASLTLTPVAADATNPSGDTVMALLASDTTVPTPVADPDFGALTGIAVTGLSLMDWGTWQYRLADASPWLSFPADLAANRAVLLNDTARIRYLPGLADGNGRTATLSFQAWDRTTGGDGDTGVDVTSAGGTTAFSLVSDTASLAILGGNRAPILDNSGSPTLTAVTEDDTNPPGDSVGARFNALITDPDLGAVKGIAITATSGDGAWQYRGATDATWTALGALSNSSALLLADTASLRFLPRLALNNGQTATMTFRAWDRTKGDAGTKADTSSNGGTTAFSAAAYTFSLRVRGGGDVSENWWYPSFSWEPVAAGRAGALYGWYHVQVFAADNLAEPYFEANVHGTTMTHAEYFLAAFDGFPGGRWLWRYRPWDPATNTYGAFIPAALTGTPDPAYALDLDYGPAATPTELAIADTVSGIHLLSFLVGNARGYEVRSVRVDDDEVRTWRHAFIPGEDPAKQQGTPATFGLDNPTMDPPEIPRDQAATLAVNLPQPGTYHLYVRGFNPSDERDGLPAFTEFPTSVRVEPRQTALPPPAATGMIPGGADLIAIPGGAATMAHRLQWDPLPGAQRFVLYLAAANASPLYNFADVGSDTRLEVALPPGSYTWQVIGLNDEGTAPTVGAWSAAQHFEIVRTLERPAMITKVERVRDSTTRLRVTWAAGGAVPDLVGVRHFYSGQRRWTDYAPRALEEVDLAAGTGVIEIADLALPGAHHVLLRGYVLALSGTYLPGQPRTFVVPRLSSAPRRAAALRAR
jgi:hypothetical protein